MAEVTILGLGNLLWADEGFGVRAAEKLFEQYADNEKVDVVDGGTQGLALLPWLQQTEKLLIMDAIDFGMAPGSLAMFRDEQVPAYLTAKKLSLHQTSFSEVLALLQLTGGQLSEIVLIGVQPECLDDYGGSLPPQVKAQLMPAVCLAQEVLAQWGITASSAALPTERLNHYSLCMERYEDERPDAQSACRVGDIRVLQREKS
ncbi:HyaD/HybD family hydrogenase maturation endopeptidase [Salmonella enterica]|nr:HyaD/HybD family hydrogenase maturation endopeptidase [Salmonella enterica]EHS0389397.1 HyaD/HybD family hydrogenase maturation endopeptidase [Salmonella enterica]